MNPINLQILRITNKSCTIKPTRRSVTLRLPRRRFEGFRSRLFLKMMYIIKKLPNVADTDVTAFIVEVAITVKFSHKVTFV